MDIGRYLEERRFSLRIPKKTLAKRAGVTTEGLRLILLNKRVPNPKTLDKLITALRMTHREGVVLREQAALARAVRTDFDIDEVARKAWDIFSDYLEDEGVSEESMPKLEETFVEILSRQLAFHRRG